jgi:hypothetical protein
MRERRQRWREERREKRERGREESRAKRGGKLIA